MVKEVPRNCSTPCENKSCLAMNRTIGCFKLFGAHIPRKEVIQKSLSIENPDTSSNGYVFDGLSQKQNGTEKAITWTKKGNQSFLLGLSKTTSKGDWRSIAKDYVNTSTTSSQGVCQSTHAKKFFNRIATSDEQQARVIQQPIYIMDGNEEFIVDGSWIEAMSYSHEPRKTMLPYHQACMYLPQTHEPFHASSSTAINQTPLEAAHTGTSPSATATATSVNLELQLALP